MTVVDIIVEETSFAGDLATHTCLNMLVAVVSGESEKVSWCHSDGFTNGISPDKLKLTAFHRAALVDRLAVRKVKYWRVSRAERLEIFHSEPLSLR